MKELDVSMSYKGFDLSDFGEDELPELVEKIEAIDESLCHLRELCRRIISASHSAPEEERRVAVLEAIRQYGDAAGGSAGEFSRLLLASLENDPPAVQVAKAKAFILSYERQFEEGDSEPVHPFEFQHTEVYRVMRMLTGGKNPVPSLIELS